ncbi:PhoH family protein [Roseivirga seohaensis]|uniref:PhoH-like protein n=2 Tax=Roseivirga seohaensis TaxID=1914963 RepID=A0A0L8AKJ2_9BACT|nr:PhoH family protein [Roseivirga seohaensis]KOF02742.1 phosphate starvation protein PhoH [Roseivirga seohaensis subsp. aquiponti]KYG85829.1 phosphate starvation-inducible protein PhoH [Roseivirga seohaensis]
MVEKLIILENIAMVDFLGVANENIKEVASAFPKSKIVSRGNEILIQGNASEIIQINDILNSLVQHYHKFGKVTHDNVKSYIKSEAEYISSQGDDGVLVYGNRGNTIKPKTANQKALVKAVEENDLVFAVGPAGTGKTYISVAMAVQALKNKEVKKIIITRPAVEAGENLGFLPGDLKEKIDPYLRPIYDALDEMIPSEKLKFYQENRVIEIAPLAYMRGRTLNHAFILLDEAQNTTAMQMKMFLTRMGPNSKVIVTGDISQIDLPRNQKSGLGESLKILSGVKGIARVDLDAKDVVRHKLVKEIISAYDKHQEQNDKSKKSGE